MMNGNPLEDEQASNKEYLFRKIVNNLNEKKIEAALEDAYAYSITIGKENYEKYFLAAIKDLALSRALGKRESMVNNPEIAYYYYDDDQNADPYEYNEPLERKLVDIRLKILEFISVAAKESDTSLDSLFKNFGKGDDHVQLASDTAISEEDVEGALQEVLAERRTKKH